MYKAHKNIFDIWRKVNTSLCDEEVVVGGHNEGLGEGLTTALPPILFGTVGLLPPGAG